MRPPTLRELIRQWPELRDAFVDGRFGVFVVCRTAAWSFLLLATNWSQTSVPSTPLAVAIFIGADAVLASRLWRNANSQLAFHFFLLASQTCFLIANWSSTNPPTVVFLLAVPLLVEVTVVYGLIQGAAVALGVLAVAGATWFVVGHVTHYEDALFNLGLILVATFPLSLLLRLGLARFWSQAAQWRKAAANLASTQAKADVVLGRGGTASENLVRALRLLAAGSSDQARLLAVKAQAHRESFYESSAREWTYLKVVLAQYAAQQRLRTASVQHQLNFAIDRDSGLVLLPPKAVAKLRSELDHLGIAGVGGQVRVSAEEYAGRVTVTIGDAAISLPLTIRHRLSVRALCILAAGVLTLTTANPEYSRLWFPGVVMVAGLTVAAGLLLNAKGEPSERPWSWVLISVIPVLGTTALEALAGTNWVNASGWSLIPNLGSISASAMIAGSAWRAMGLSRLAAVVSCWIAALAFSFWLTPVAPPPWPMVVGELIWPTETFALVAMLVALTARVENRSHDRWAADLPQVLATSRTNQFLHELSVLEAGLASARDIANNAPPGDITDMALAVLDEAVCDVEAARATAAEG